VETDARRIRRLKAESTRRKLSNRSGQRGGTPWSIKTFLGSLLKVVRRWRG
jgi:hypothetical protein